jgi:hypothetical protein
MKRTPLYGLPPLNWYKVHRANIFRDLITQKYLPSRDLLHLEKLSAGSTNCNHSHHYLMPSKYGRSRSNHCQAHGHHQNAPGANWCITKRGPSCCCYHIPNAKVHLLSPQILLKTIGGHALQNDKEIAIVLDNGLTFCVKYCPTSNLPLIPLALWAHSKTCFWTIAFGFTADGFCETNAIKTVLHQFNMNLSASQKEHLLWHQRLSHALTNWIQTLMRDRLWLPDADKCSRALHSGPFFPMKSCMPRCDTSKLKCAACLYAKALTQTPNNQAACPFLKARILRENQLMPGDCISADHYFSPVQGHLPHTFGKERHRYSCGSLFVDHASGKISNFLQYLNTAHKTLQSINWLEAMAREEGFKIKSYHSNSGIFASADFKAHCERSLQTFSFSGVGAKHQTGIAERNIKTIAQWACANMLHLATHWPQCADSKFWPQATDYTVWVFNRLPSLDSGIAPNELWSGVQAHGTDIHMPMFLAAPFMSLTHLFRMERQYQSGAPGYDLASILDSQTYTCLRFLWSWTLPLVTYLPNFM